MFLFTHRPLNFMTPALHENWDWIASSWIKWIIPVPIALLKTKITAFTLLPAFFAYKSLCWYKGIKYSEMLAGPSHCNFIKAMNNTYITYFCLRKKQNITGMLLSTHFVLLYQTPWGLNSAYIMLIVQINFNFNLCHTSSI